MQDQLKTYDKDILQELWKIRTTVQTLREVDKKPPRGADETRFLDDTMEDRSPTPESQPHESEEGDRSLPPSPSPSPEYLAAADGSRYTQETLERMTSAPSHLRKSSDDLVLEEFFGTEQLTKLNMFKKTVSTDSLLPAKETSRGGEGLPQIAEEGGMRPGVSMPNISSNPSSSSNLSHPDSQERGPPVVKLRLAKKNSQNNSRLSDANRMSYDVASEMEKLRSRLQETAKQELAEFDRKYSPKLHHPGVMAVDGANNHSRQGSLDSSMPQQSATPPLEATPISGQRGNGHTRQHSLPIDPKFLRQLQQSQSNETTPTLATHSSGWSPSLGNADKGRSPSPPLLFGHIRQVSGGSMSSDGGTFSPPLTPNFQPSPQDGHTHQVPQNHTSFGRAPHPTGAGLPTQHFKQSNPPGMARIGSDGGFSGYSHNRGSSGSLSRTSPEEGNGGRSRASTTAATTQPHYSTSVIKRGGKRGSLEITPPPPAQQPGGVPGFYKYGEEKRPNAYEQPKRHSRGEDMEVGDVRHLSRVGSSNGSIGSRYPQFSPPRMEGNLIPSSPKLARAPPPVERHGSDKSGVKPPLATKLQTRASEPARMNSQQPSGQDDIQPYMTSSHVKSQMQILNFNYTPFSQHKVRSNTVASADAPKLSKQLPNAVKSAKNTWI